MLDPKTVLPGMQPWRKFGAAKSVRARTVEQTAFDAGVCAAAEFVRRVTGDESLALEIHGLLTPTVGRKAVRNTQEAE